MKNCWEFKNCGRQPGGGKVGELGACPAATFAPADGYLGGTNGGRACAYLTGTFCGGQIQGTRADKEKNCQACGFYKEVRAEHGASLSVLSFARHIKEKT